MKMNKKGFTLIEMLVVIAIIAVLVAIVIPTVSSATGKAAAATNAANLRSLVAEATTKYLSADTTDNGNVTIAISNTGVPTATVNASAPKSKACGSLTKDQVATLTWDANAQAFVASYNGYSLAALTAVADGTVAPNDMAADITVTPVTPPAQGDQTNNNT